MYSRNENRAAGPSVLIVGMGALGCPAADTLARSGAVSLTLIDDDRVETSNLQRQILFDSSDVDAPKVEAAARRLAERHGPGPVSTIAARLDAAGADALVAAHDFVIDACDDPATKLLINRVAVRCSTAFAYGGVMRTGGQTMTVVPGQSACLACAFPELAATGAAGDDLGSCSDMGILAPVAGVIGSLQAAAALDWLGPPRASEQSRGHGAGIMKIYELRGRRWRSVAFPRVPGCSACGEHPGAHETRRLEPCPT